MVPCASLSDKDLFAGAGGGGSDVAAALWDVQCRHSVRPAWPTFTSKHCLEHQVVSILGVVVRFALE